MELPLFCPLIYMGLGCGNVSGSHFRAAGCLCLFSPAIQCRPLRPARPQPLICNAERASRASLCLSCSPCPHFGWQGGMPCPTTLERGRALSSQCPVAFSSWLLWLPPGTVKTFRLTRSEALGNGEAAGCGICDTQQLCTSNSPLPLSSSTADTGQ